MTNPIQTIREALAAYASNETEGMNGVFRACCSVRPNEPHAEHCMVNAALTALAELERTHYTAEDVADASAQGFRDGVASVTAGQGPVAWGMQHTDGAILDVISPEEHAREEGGYVVPLYRAAPVAQQPRLQVGDSQFESWYNEGFDPKNKGLKQHMREAYEAGMNDPVAKQPQAEPLCEDEGCPHSGTKHVCISPPQAEVAPMSQPNRLIAYSAAAKLRGLGYQWDEEAEAWAPQQAEAVPPGYVLVPVEPTDEMLKAAAKACDGRMYPADMRHGPRAQNSDRYRAMLAAAPKGQP